MKIAEKILNTIDESSLSRLWQHNQKHDCGAITAFRIYKDPVAEIKYTKAENLKRNQALTARLIIIGYRSITKISSIYPEDGKPTRETSYFVVDLKDKGTLEEDLSKLGVEFEQDSILFAPKGSINGKAKAYLIGTGTSDWIKSGEKRIFNTSKLGQASSIYTTYINGKPFYFDEVNEQISPPNTGMGYWALGLRAKDKI